MEFYSRGIDWGDLDFGYQSHAAVRGLDTFTSFIGLAAAVLMIIGMWRCFEKAGTPGWHALIPFYNIYELCRVFWTKKMGIAIIVLSAVGGGLMFIGIIMFAFEIYNVGIVNWFSLVDHMAQLSPTVMIGVILLMVGSIPLCIAAILMLVAYIKLAKCFGKEGGFLVGMFFVPVVFLCILAFGKAEFLGNVNDKDNPYRPQPAPNPQPYGQQPYSQPQANAYTQPEQPAQAPVQPAQSAPAAAAPETAANAAPQSDSVQAPKFCSGCGSPIEPGDRFCKKCGKQIG